MRKNAYIKLENIAFNAKTMKALTRRKLLKTSLKAALVAPMVNPTMLMASTTPPKLNILILGGTSFLGPHQVAYALSRGHRVSTFTRGITEPTVHKNLFKQVESLVGDRENDLSALENGQWDLVIDNSGRRVHWTEKTAQLLKDKAELYLYTSSTGVYYPYLTDDIKEDTKLVLQTPDTASEDEKYIYDYGVMKANSELAAIKAFGADRSIIVRPTYMVGPADKLDRFIHWPVRLARGGEVLVPGKADDQVQYVDVRDVAEFMIRLAEQKKTGTFNAVGPPQPQTMHEFVDIARKAFDVDTTLVKIDDYDFLEENKVHFIVPWIPSSGNNYGSARINNQKAIKAGLTYRDINKTIKDTHDWWYSDALTDERRAKFEDNPQGILAREAEIIAKWKEFK